MDAREAETEGHWEGVSDAVLLPDTEGDSEAAQVGVDMGHTEGEEVGVEGRVGVPVPPELWVVVRVVVGEGDTRGDWVMDGITEEVGVTAPDPLPSQLLLWPALLLGEAGVLPERETEAVEEEERQRVGVGEGENRPLEDPPPPIPASEALKEGEWEGVEVWEGTQEADRDKVGGGVEEGGGVALPSSPEVGVAAPPSEPLERGVWEGKGVGEVVDKGGLGVLP